LTSGVVQADWPLPAAPRDSYQPPWPASWWRYISPPRPKTGCVLVIVTGEADERAIQSALSARGIRGGIAGICHTAGTCGRPSAFPIIHHAHVAAVLRGGGITDVVFAGRPEMHTTGVEIFHALFEGLFGLPARIWLAVDISASFPAAAKIRAGGYRLVPALGEHQMSAGAPLKRLFDIGGAAVLLALFSPVMALIAAALFCSGTTKIIYRQQRAGAGGKLFHLLKFRTMTTPDDAEFLQARPGDCRITRLGRWLRKNSLDELPQLFNVLAGHMSLVGPRPHAPATTVAGLSLEDAAKFYRLRYRAKPGMTGLAQIRGQRGATGNILTLEQRLSSDLEYIESWSPWLDLRILLRTIPAVLRPCNAY